MHTHRTMSTETQYDANFVYIYLDTLQPTLYINCERDNGEQEQLVESL
jgi:hypothetical protein